MPDRIISLFRNLLCRDAVERRLDDELQSSLELLTEEKINEGLSRSEARRRALIELGGIEQVRTQVREIRTGRLLEDFFKDLRFAFRTFLKSPGLSAIIIISLAVGIAANTTVFSVANGLFWDALPVKDPGRMVLFSGGKSFSYPDYLDFRDQTVGVFDGGVSACYPLVPASLGGAGEPERIWGQLVSGNYFTILGVSMALGRANFPNEEQPAGSGHVVVLSQNLWLRHFGADAGIIGRDVVLNGQHYTVVGIAPTGFHGAERGIISDFWVPLSMAHQIVPGLTAGGNSADRGSSWLMLNARLAPGVSHARAVAAVNLVKKRLDEAYHKNEKRREFITLESASELPGLSASPAFALVTVLMIIATTVLLVACANVANLLLARATQRQQEMAVRLAIGARRARLVRQLLTEGLVLAVAGAGLGFLLAAAGAKELSSFRLPIPMPLVFNFNVDVRVAAFTIGVSIVTTLLFGLVPAFRVTRPEVIGALKASLSISGRIGRSRIRNTLVVVQVAFSLVLLAAAGLFLRSLQRAISIDVGFNPDNILVERIDPQLQGYSPERTIQLLTQLRSRVLAMPGVRSVSFVDLVPLSLANNGRSFSVQASKDSPMRNVDTDVRGIFGAYFQTMGIPFLEGHDFAASRDEGPAVIINETMAGNLFPNQDPIGRVIRAGKLSYKIIGVVRNSKSRTVGETPRNCSYLLLDASPGNGVNFFGISMLLKTAVDPRMMDRPVREQIAELDSNMAVFNTETMREQFSQALLLPRMSAWLLGCFAAVGLILGAVGLYGVMSYSARCRTHEIGVRMAMGARRNAVVTLIVRQGLTLTCIGLAIGLALALLVGRISAGLLYGVGGADLVTFLTVPTVLLAVALVAIVIPARRAAQVDPAAALRNE